jgi:hypothetical protein
MGGAKTRRGREAEADSHVPVRGPGVRHASSLNTGDALQAWMCVTVTVIGAALYLNSLGNDFTFDDPYAVKKNKEARWNAEWSTLITHDYWGTDVMAYDSQSATHEPVCIAYGRIAERYQRQCKRSLAFGCALTHSVSSRSGL